MGRPPNWKVGDLAKRSLKEDAIVRREVAEAQANRVTQTADSFQNFAAQLGMGTQNLLSASTYSFNPVTRIRTLLEWIHRGSWLGGMAVDLIADDMTRAGVQIKGELDPDKIEAIEEAATSLGIWNALNDSIKWARLYGGCLAFMMIDGQAMNTPFRIETVGKGQFQGLLVLDRWMVEPSLNDLVQSGPSIGMPKFYRVAQTAPGLNGGQIHYSRCVRLEGIRLPYWQRVMENLWGISVIERLYDRMVAFDSATQGASQLAYKSYLRTYGIEGLREIVAAGGELMQGLVNQVNFMKLTQSNEGVTLLDTKDEFETHSAGQTATGIADIILQLAQQISGALQIPLVRLLGQSPAGLNSSGDSDLRTYYDGIKAQQVRCLKSPVTTIYRAIAQSIGIKPPRGFSIDFNPLWQLTETEKGAIASQDAETIDKIKQTGLVSDQVLLKELKQSANVSGRWTNIGNEDIEAASDVPEPPITEEPVPGEPGSGSRETADALKLTKAEVGYVDKATASDHCARCIHYEIKGSCRIVQGDILPMGWCRRFANQ